MSPLRLLLLLFLFYMLYRLLTGGRKSGTDATDNRKGQQPLSHDVLEEDPVCHTYIPRGQAIKLQEKDVTRYFCSEACRNTYIEQSKKD